MYISGSNVLLDSYYYDEEGNKEQIQKQLEETNDSTNSQEFSIPYTDDSNPSVEDSTK